MANVDEKNIAKYNAALSVHNNECQIQWTRFSALLVVNTILIGLIGLTYNTSFKFPPLLTILLKFLPIAGLLICYWWLRVTTKGFKWIHFWIKEAREIEVKFSNINNKNDPHPINNGKTFAEENEPRITETASKWIISTMAVVYALLFIANIYSLGSGTHHEKNTGHYEFFKIKNNK